MRPRADTRVALCRARSLAVMVYEVRGCGRNHVNIKRRGRGFAVRRPVRTVVKPRRRKSNTGPAGGSRHQQQQQLHRLPGPDARAKPRTAPPGKAPRKTRTSTSSTYEPTATRREALLQYEITFAISRATTEARLGHEVPLTARRARREYMEDAPAEPIGGSIRKTPQRLLGVHLPRLVAANRRIGGEGIKSYLILNLYKQRGGQRGSSKGAGRRPAQQLQTTTTQSQHFAGVQRVPGGSHPIQKINNLGYRRIRSHTAAERVC